MDALMTCEAMRVLRKRSMRPEEDLLRPRAQPIVTVGHKMQGPDKELTP